MNPTKTEMSREEEDLHTDAKQFRDSMLMVIGMFMAKGGFEQRFVDAEFKGFWDALMNGCAVVVLEGKEPTPPFIN